MRGHVELLVGAVVLLSLTNLGAQFAVQSPRTFEAASIKLNRSGAAQAFQRVLPGGRYTAINLGLLPMIRFAYAQSPRSRGLEPFEVTGGPVWGPASRIDARRRRALRILRPVTEDRSQLR